jgi:hypothetical protein
MLHHSLILLALSLIPAQGPKFETQVIDDHVSIGYGLAIGDVDVDGKPDILLADKKEFVWYRNGDWKRFVMVENLTESDNVCIAARDIDGDGKVEVAVGAQWNPGETSDTTRSGSVHYLVRPKDPTQRWRPVELHHEPVIHRMRWVRTQGNRIQLIVVPLHGRGNKGGEGKGVRVFAYEMPSDPDDKWKLTLLDESMHMTHNLDVVQDAGGEMVFIGGKEGIKELSFKNARWFSGWLVHGHGFGEVRVGGRDFIAGIEPMHGNELTLHRRDDGRPIDFNKPGKFGRTVLSDALNQGHALAIADLAGSGQSQIVVGWREPDKEGKVGVKVFTPHDKKGTKWDPMWVDENGMACEDLKVADLNGDSRPEIIAAGRATHNLKIYWNRTR